MRTTPIVLGCALLLCTTVAAAQEAPPPKPPPPKHRNEAMRISGIVLTSLGAASLVTGLAFTFGPGWGRCGDIACESVFYGLFVLIPLSTALAGAGIPLWAVGGQSPKPRSAAEAPTWALPSIGAGPRSVSLRWTF